ncbi:MAG: hypothetical protein ACSHX7_11415 [Luteolibacter sp.]
MKGEFAGVWMGSCNSLENSAPLGQKCRDKWVNAGSLNLLIAALALHQKAEAMKFDADYVEIAEVCGLSATILKRPCEQ